MEIFRLIGTVMVNTQEAANSLQRLEGTATNAGKSMSSTFSELANIGKLTYDSLYEIGKYFYDLADEAATYGDIVDKASQRMNITTEDYQELEYAAGMCGISMDVLERASKQLEGTDLDVSTAIENIMSVEDLTARREAAIQTFGENVAYQLEPLLQTTKEDYDALKQEVHDLGGVMSHDGVKQSAAFKDAVARLDKSWQGLKTTVGLAVMPALTNLIDWITWTAMPKIREFTDAVTWVFDNSDWGFSFEWGSSAAGAAGMYRDKMKGNSGSFATGLPTVPYDGFQPILHRGETVLNANDTGKLKDLLDGNAGDGAPVNITVQNILDGKVIGEFTYQYNRRKAQALGV